MQQNGGQIISDTGIRVNFDARML